MNCYKAPDADVLEIDFNGRRTSDLGVYLYDYPVFSGAQNNYDQTPVAGRLGELVGINQYTGNATIECTLGIIDIHFMEKKNYLKSWLRGPGRLAFSDNEDYFYKTWKTDFGETSREKRGFGTFKVTFTATPFVFAKSGQQSVSPEECAFNPYDECRPIYTITGTGSFTLTVNGNTMTGTVNGTLVIDTERLIAYNAAGVRQSSLVSGDYDGLVLVPGNNSVAISGSNASLSVVPQWGWKM